MRIAKSPAAPRERWRVLLVDDDPWMRRIMRASLTSLAQVVECSSAEEALGAIDREPFDVVCSDLVMPGMSGAELLDRVARSHAGVGLLLVTGAEEQLTPEDRAALAVLRKPFDPDCFVSIVARLASAAAGAPGVPTKLAVHGGDR